MATLPPLPSEFGVSIVATDVEKTKTGHPFTIYVMKINRKWKRNVTDREVWTARRRYREFRSLRKKLLRDYPSLKEVPFPGKKYFSRMADAVVEDRRWKLERFLSRVLSLPFPKEGNGLLNRFLGAEDDVSRVSNLNAAMRNDTKAFKHALTIEKGHPDPTVLHKRSCTRHFFDDVLTTSSKKNVRDIRHKIRDLEEEIDEELTYVFETAPPLCPDVHPS
mmetsp:Transcript_41279/g.106799  ORF Transcript_41279/g.106799 Transcript_41279/m.106799 type:complete len:220 (+) Transcript_41279:248-907(+)